jgi:hypothetical protein
VAQIATPLDAPAGEGGVRFACFRPACERRVMYEFLYEASRSLAQLSPIDGLRNALLFPLGLLRDRRLRARRRAAA